MEPRPAQHAPTQENRMSLIDELREVKARVAARLRELEPLVAEYNELVEEAERLGIATDAERVTAGKPAAAAAEPKRPRPAKRRAAAKRASRRRGATEASQRDAIVAEVAEDPGMTVADIAKRLGVEAASLYREVRELTNEGVLIKRGRQLYPPE